MKIDRHTTKISIAKEVMPAKRERGKYIQIYTKSEKRGRSFQWKWIKPMEKPENVDNPFFLENSPS